MENLLNQIDNLVWGVPLLMLLVGTGIYLTIRLKLLQILKLPLALKYVFKKDDESTCEDAEGDVSSFGAAAKVKYPVSELYVQPFQQL